MVNRKTDRRTTRRGFFEKAGAAALGIAPVLGVSGAGSAAEAERIDCARKSPYWQNSALFPRAVAHPLFYRPEQIARARERVARYDWAKQFLQSLVRDIDQSHLLQMPDDAIRAEIFDQVGFPLPRCPVDRRQRSWRQEFWAWSKGDPSHVRCRICGSVFPLAEHEPTGAVEVVGPSGKSVVYRYWQDQAGFRYFFHNMVLNYRQEWIAAKALPLALAHVLTGEPRYAHKAAVILARLAEVYPHYPVHGLGQSFSGADAKGRYENHFYREPPFPFVSARWGNFHDSPFSDASRAFVMGQVYDLILGSGAIEELSQRAGHDVRAAIERDLLFEAAKHTLDTPMSPTNYDGSRMMGLGLAGRLLDEPGFVAAAYDVYRNLIDNCFFSDHYWCEDAVNYFFMIVGDLLPVPEILSGSGGVDVHRELPFLPQVYTAPLGLFFPNGRSMPINDSWAWNTRGRSNDIGSMGEFVEVADDAAGNNRLPAVDSTFALFRRSSDAQRAVRAGELKALIPQNTLLPAAGEAVLGIGKGDDAVRVTFSFGPWGGHHHHDTLALSHYALGEELLSDIGYTWTTYRPWSTSAASHNTVLVDGQEQSEAGGNLLAFRPASALQAGFVSAEAPRAFPNTTTYRRSIVLLPTREDGGYIVDLFEVAGGSTHDYLLHGSADWDQHLTVSPDPRWAADAVTRGKAASRSARSEYVRNVRSAPATDGLRAAFTGKGVSVDVWFLETNGMRVVVGEGPSVRRAHEDDGQLPNSWRPLLCLRQSGGTSRFVTLIEAHRADGAVQSVKCVASQGTGIVLQVRERQCVRFLGIDPAGIGVSTRLPDGRVFELDGRLGIATEAEGKTTLDMCDAARLHVGDAVLENTRSYQGRVLGLAGDVTGQPERSELVTDTRLPDGETLAGKVIYVSHSSGAQSAYRIDRVEADREGSRVFLAGKPRFVLGRGQVKSGGPGKVESNVELPAAGAYAGQRIRVGQRVFTIRNTTGRASVGTEESFDFASLAGERFTVFSVAPGDRFRIAV